MFTSLMKIFNMFKPSLNASLPLSIHFTEGLSTIINSSNFQTRYQTSLLSSNEFSIGIKTAKSKRYRHINDLDYTNSNLTLNIDV